MVARNQNKKIYSTKTPWPIEQSSTGEEASRGPGWVAPQAKSIAPPAGRIDQEDHGAERRADD